MHQNQTPNPMRQTIYHEVINSTLYHGIYLKQALILRFHTRYTLIFNHLTTIVQSLRLRFAGFWLMFRLGGLSSFFSRTQLTLELVAGKTINYEIYLTSISKVTPKYTRKHRTTPLNELIYTIDKVVYMLLAHDHMKTHPVLVSPFMTKHMPHFFLRL